MKEFNLIRAAFYLWVAYECALLGYLYQWGYDQMKKTPIIGALKNFFLVLTGFFLYLVSVAAADYFSPSLRETLSYLIPFPLLMVLKALRSFRYWSLRQK